MTSSPSSSSVSCTRHQKTRAWLLRVHAMPQASAALLSMRLRVLATLLSSATLSLLAASVHELLAQHRRMLLPLLPPTATAMFVPTRAPCRQPMHVAHGLRWGVGSRMRAWVHWRRSLPMRASAHTRTCQGLRRRSTGTPRECCCRTRVCWRRTRALLRWHQPHGASRRLRHPQAVASLLPRNRPGQHMMQQGQPLLANSRA